MSPGRDRKIMKKPDWTVCRRIAFGLLPVVMLACSAKETVSFSADVKPALDKYCLECHQPGGAGFEASGLDLTSYEGVMAGAKNGRMVIPGDSLGSNLLVLMEGRADPSIKMPHGSSNEVSSEEIEAIRTWIDEGALNN